MRPLLVLVLVIVAIAALIFGIIQVMPDSPSQTGGPSTTTEATDDPKPHTSTNLDGGDPSNGSRVVEAPATPSDRIPDPSAVVGFDNALVGVVRDPQGKAVAGAEVTISTAITGDMFFVNDPIDTSNDITKRTDGEGRFAFQNIEPRARYRLTVKHPEFTRYEENSVPVGESGTFTEPPITMTQGATLVGHVRDEAGNVVNDALIYLDGMIYQGSPSTPPDRMSTKTNAQGEFTILNVPKGQRAMTVIAAGYGTTTFNGLIFDKEGTVSRDVTLKVGEMICGRVVDEKNQGIPDARITALGFSSTQQSARGDAVSGPTGDFCLENLAPGPYNVVAVVKGYRSERALRVETGTSNVTLDVVREANVSGQVVDGVSGAPVSNFTCRLRFFYGPGLPTAASEIRQDFNSPNGEFVLEGVPQSEYVVEAIAPGYAPSFSSQFTVLASKSATGVVVRMTRGGTLSGRVVDGDGKPIARARITTHDNEWTDDDFSQILGNAYPTNTTAAEARTDDKGAFVLKGLGAEKYQINVQAGGYTRLVRTDIQVIDGNETKLGDLVLARGGTLRGTVFDPAGKPLAGAHVTLNALEGTPDNYAAKSGDDGKFLIVNIVPKSYELAASRSSGLGANPFEQVVDNQNSKKRVIVSENQTTVEDLTLSD